jgi:tetratricopeptide (TPR) repeat protein
MRAFVFTDAALARYAGRFVWLAVDTENAVNAGFLKKYPIRVMPTLLILDPDKEQVALRYAGGATVPQLEKLFADGERAVRGATGPADAALLRGDQLANEGKTGEAARAYLEAVDTAPKGWSRLGRAAESLTFALYMAHDYPACAARALELYPRLRGTYSSANVASNGLACASELPEHGATFESLEKACRETLDDPKIPLSGDDRSGLYETLIGAREAVKDEAGRRKLVEEWAAYLEREAQRAKTPEQRAVYDSHRLSAYLDLKEPERAIPMLLLSEQDFPGDYNPPARLGVAYRAAGRYDEALAAYDRALAKAYGPRKIGIYRGKAEACAAKGDKAAARKTLEEAIAYAEALPDGQRSENAVAGLKKRLAAI